MSTFAVFGMTREAALAEARKKTPTTKPEIGGGNRILSEAEWLDDVEAAVEATMRSSRVRQLSQLFDAPQFARQFIDMARASVECRDMRIRAKCQLRNADGTPVTDQKTGAPKYEFVDWNATGEA